MGFEGRICLGIPHLGNLPGYFFDSFSALSKPEDTYALRVENKPVDVARNMIVEGMLAGTGEGKAFTHLLFMDADMIFPTDALIRLVQSDKDVISGTYFMRQLPPSPHLYELHHVDNPDGTCPLAKEGEDGKLYEPAHKDGYRGHWYRPLNKDFLAYMRRHKDYNKLPGVTTFPHTPDALTRVAAFGAGCLLIKREVLEAMSWPWFKSHERSAGGEDFYFARQAAEAGFELWGNFAVQCKHEFKGEFIDREDWKHGFNIGKRNEHDFESTPTLVQIDMADDSVAG